MPLSLSALIAPASYSSLAPSLDITAHNHKMLVQIDTKYCPRDRPRSKMRSWSHLQTCSSPVSAASSDILTEAFIERILSSVSTTFCVATRL